MKFSSINKSAVFLVVIFLIIISVGIFIFFSLRENPVEEKLKNEPVLKVLFVVHDEKNHCLMTDIFMYNPQSEKSALFDILGNTGSIYDSIGRVDRIDAVYAEKGIETYRKEIEKLTLTNGQEIPFTIELSLENFGVLTDLLGGLKVFVPSPVDYTGENGDRWLLPSGAVTLDGDKIQTFIKYAIPGETSSDIEDRRQAALIALFTAIKEGRNSIFSKKNFPYFASRFTTNLDKDGLYKIMSSFLAIETERLTPNVITGSLRVVDGQTLLFPYYNGQLIKEVVAQTTASLMSNDTNMKNGVYVLEILNGTTERGRARNTAFLLGSAGYEVLEAANADRNDYEHTLIINHSANPQAAQALADFIKCKNIQTEEIDADYYEMSNVARADFTIILGKDFDGRYVKGGYTPDKDERQNKKSDDSNEKTAESQ